MEPALSPTLDRDACGSVGTYTLQGLREGPCGAPTLQPPKGTDQRSDLPGTGGIHRMWVFPALGRVQQSVSLWRGHVLLKAQSGLLEALPGLLTGPALEVPLSQVKRRNLTGGQARALPPGV